MLTKDEIVFETIQNCCCRMFELKEATKSLEKSQSILDFQSNNLFLPFSIHYRNQLSSCRRYSIKDTNESDLTSVWRQVYQSRSSVTTRKTSAPKPSCAHQHHHLQKSRSLKSFCWQKMTLFSSAKETTLKRNQHGQLNAPCCTPTNGFKGNVAPSTTVNHLGFWKREAFIKG